jgi:hypothetical protein
VFAGALISAGFLIDAETFLPHLIAVLAELSAGVFVALCIVDPLQTITRRVKWRGVRDHTVEALCSHLSNIVTQFAIYLPLKTLLSAPLNLGRDQPSRDALVRFDRFLALALERQASMMGSRTSDLHSKVKSDTDQIVRVLMPWIVQFADDPQLLAVLMKLEKAERRWASSLALERHVGPSSSTGAALSLLKAVIGTYQQLVDSYAGGQSISTEHQPARATAFASCLSARPRQP